MLDEQTPMLRNGLNNLVGVPFLHKGRDPKIGLDCFGVVIEIYKWYGITISDAWAYDEGLPGKQKMTIVHAIGEEWSRIGLPEVPCVCLFKWGAVPTHIGVYVERNKFIHSLKAREQVIVERVDLQPYKNALEGYYEYRGSISS